VRASGQGECPITKHLDDFISVTMHNQRTICLACTLANDDLWSQE
jgi:hypothetical protein